jgi:predicted tellurium resistance membrane protein TerC
MVGGFLGLIMMRFAASLFIRLLEKFPRFEPTAYLLVFIIGIKLIVDGFKFPGVDFHHSSSPAFWIFWVSMGLSLCFGFTHRKKSRA